jgi:lysophosphatidate acyltransferase
MFSNSLMSNHFTVLPPIPTSGLLASDVAELTTQVRDQMLAALREISVKVASEEIVKAADQPNTETNLPPVEESEPAPTTTAEVAPEEVPDSPSESGSEVPGVDVPMARSLKQEGSVSEYGETDDEGMVVVVGRH